MDDDFQIIHKKVWNYKRGDQIAVKWKKSIYFLKPNSKQVTKYRKKASEPRKAADAGETNKRRNTEEGVERQTLRSANPEEKFL